jgi:hypothetical protein
MNIQAIVGRFRALPNENRQEFLKGLEVILGNWKLYGETMESIRKTHDTFTAALYREGASRNIGRSIKALFNDFNISLPNKSLKIILTGNIQSNLQAIYYPCKLAHSQMISPGLTSGGSNLIH